MPKQIVFQSDFTGGVVSPRLLGRIDSDKLKKSLREATNCIVQPHGPVKRRNGTKYISEVKTSSKTVRLIPFQVSSTLAYMLEMGDGYTRFYTDGAQIQSGGFPYEIATTYAEADLPSVQYTQLGDVAYLVQPSYIPKTLTRTNSTSWAMQSLSFNPPPVYQLGYRPATTLTPAATTGTGVNFTAGASVPFQAGDVGRQLINYSGTGKAVIVSITSGTVVVCDILEAFPNTSAIASQSWALALSPIAELNITGNGKLGERITILAEDTGSAAAQATFRSNDVGKYLRFSGGLAKIITYTSSSVVNAVCVAALDVTTKTTVFTMEEEIWNSTNGYPSAIGQYQQRLVFGGSSAYPQTVWLSGSGVFDFFAGGADAADSISATLVSQAVNKVVWMSSTNDLIIGTTGSEFAMKSADGSGQPLTPTSADAKPYTSYGSDSPQTPVQIGGDVIFVQKGGKALRSYNFNYNKNSYQAGEITFWAEQLATSGVKEMAYAQYPDSLLYVVMDDGTMLVGTYKPELDPPIVGWTKWETDGLYENVSVLNTGGNDQVWVVVKRTINGSTKRYIEILDTGDGTDSLDSFSDSYLTLSNPHAITNITKANPAVVTSTAHGMSNGDVVRLVDVGGMTEVNGRTFTIANVAANTFELSGTNSTAYTTYTSGGIAHKQVTTITGLSHLEGKEIELRVDGSTHPNKTVSSGSVTLDYAGGQVVAGLPYSSPITTLPLITETSLGQMSGQKIRWTKPTLRLLNSALPTLSGNFVPARSPQDRMDLATPLFSGDKVYDSIGWGDGSLEIVASGPQPFTLQAIFGTIDSGAL